MYRAQNNKLCRTLLCVLTSEQVTENRNIPQPRDLAVLVCDPVIHESGDHEALTILHFKLGLRAPCAQGRYSKAGNGQRIGEIELAHFGHHLKMNIVVRHDHRRKFQLHTEFTELYGHCSKALAGLHDWEREFSSRQEARFLAIDSDKVRLRQNLQEIFLL